MKKISLWVIILSFPVLLTSCSTDEFTGETEHTAELSETVLKKSLPTPQNIENGYDNTGVLHNHILDIYLSANHNHTTIEEVNDEIQQLVYGFSGVVPLALGVNSINSPVSQIMDIIDSPESSLSSIILESHLTNEAKINLTDFISSLLLLQDEAYEDKQQFIISYESSVIADTLLNNEDKRVILTTSSLIRYSLYYGKDREDKDWETSVGNITAAVSGALDNSSVAIHMTLVTGISLSVLFTE